MEKKSLKESPFDNIPDKCGVYLMKDQHQKILYIGKANNLKKRMKQYQTGKEDTRLQIPFLLEKVHSVDTFITFTEKEALILENTLIKKHKPRYNILLKDDKNYTCVALKISSDYPSISLLRYPLKNEKAYATSKPFTSSLSAKTHYEIIRRVFQIRSCSDQEFKNRTRPCILYNIDKCSAPCVKKCTKKDYSDSVKGAKLYLLGDTKKVTSYLKEERAKASQDLLFEKAAHFHKMLLSIDGVKSHTVSVTASKNIDVLAIIQKSGFCIIYKLIFRNKLLVDGKHYSFSNIASNTNATLSAFIHQHYEKNDEKPDYIFTPEKLIDEKALSSLLKIKIENPRIGEKSKLVSLAIENAREVLERESLQEESSDEILIELKSKLKLKNLPIMIECIDTSCLSGKDAVASVVVFKHGIPERSLYRNYHIDSKVYSDDISAMKEVIKRRYSKIKTYPDLIIIDGGKGQLGILDKGLKELNIINIEIAALTKEQSRHDKGLTKERIFTPNQKEAYTFDRHSHLLFFLQNIRDEAHRRAITFHRKKKVKNSIASLLDVIEGIGPKKKQLLLKTFGSINGIKNASDEELLALPSISKTDLKNLRDIIV
ncbi:MAG: UvrABC system protein C [Chlamydiia bacterium]|nr:UvrABC system protein C [Chlamydiia bacterium]